MHKLMGEALQDGIMHLGGTELKILLFKVTVDTGFVGEKV